MLKKEQLLRLKIVTLKKKIAMQIQKKYALSREEWNKTNALGWIETKHIEKRYIPVNMLEALEHTAVNIVM